MFQSYVANNSSYLRYLNADYINSVGQGQLFLRVVKELTNEQLSSINKDDKKLNVATYP